MLDFLVGDLGDYLDCNPSNVINDHAGENCVDCVACERKQGYQCGCGCGCGLGKLIAATQPSIYIPRELLFKYQTKRPIRINVYC